MNEFGQETIKVAEDFLQKQKILPNTLLLLSGAGKKTQTNIV